MFVSRNTSGFLAEVYVSTDKRGVKSSVAVVRGTFDVATDGTAKPSGKQTPFVYADAHYGDPATTAVQSESDFVPIKPRAEVLLNANAVPPSKRGVDQLEVSLVGPGLAKHAIVTGERRWTTRLLAVSPTTPKPFHNLPLAWHLAFGGADNSDKNPKRHRCELRNPIGTGFHVNSSSESIDGVLLPCIEHPRERMKIWSDTPEPTGFGPVSRFAKSRARFAGTYDQKWMDEDLPFLPADFDDRYFQAAPEDQQLDRLTPGDEFTCLNMSREGRFVVRVPVLDVEVGFLFDDKTYRKSVRPDTLIIEPHKKRVILVGRTSVELPRKFTRLREVVVTPQRRSGSGKPRYKNLAEGVAAEARLK